MILFKWIFFLIFLVFLLLLSKQSQFKKTEVEIKSCSVDDAFRFTLHSLNDYWTGETYLEIVHKLLSNFRNNLEKFPTENSQLSRVETRKS